MAGRKAEVGSGYLSGDALAGSSVGGVSRAATAVLGAIARGVSSEDAAGEAGVPVAVGVRWFREGGGMPTVTQAPLSGRYLSFVEREEIAILRARGCAVRGIACSVGRSPSTISRELQRNAATRESDSAISIRLEDPDGAPLPAARPCQYLTLGVQPHEQQRSVSRNYSLFGPPGAGYYRGLPQLRDHAHRR
jgi:hypothetical protein